MQGVKTGEGSRRSESRRSKVEVRIAGTIVYEGLEHRLLDVRPLDFLNLKFRFRWMVVLMGG